MVCLGVEPGATGWKVQTNPLSYGGTPSSTKTLGKHLLQKQNKSSRFRQDLNSYINPFGACSKFFGFAVNQILGQWSWHSWQRSPLTYYKDLGSNSVTGNFY